MSGKHEVTTERAETRTARTAESNSKKNDSKQFLQLDSIRSFGPRDVFGRSGALLHNKKRGRCGIAPAHLFGFTELLAPPFEYECCFGGLFFGKLLGWTRPFCYK